MMKKLILSLILTLGIISAHAQFIYPIYNPTWYDKLKVNQLYFSTEKDTSDITNPVLGLMIFQSSDSALYLYKDYWSSIGGSITGYMKSADFSDSINAYIDTSKVLYLTDSTVKYVTPKQLRDSLNDYQTLDSLYLNGKWITEFSDDGTMGDGDESVLPTQKAVKNYVQNVLSQSNNFVSITQFGAVPDDGQTDADAIQKTLDWVAGHGGIAYIPAGRFDIDTTLLISSNTTLYSDNSAEIFLMDSTNLAMLKNKNYNFLDPTVPFLDSNITIIGGTWLGNGDNQKWFGGDLHCDKGTNGLQIAAAKNIRLYDVAIVNTQMYSCEFRNVRNVYVDHLYIKQYENEISLPMHNQDGLHFDGPASNIFITNSLIRSVDDGVALVANYPNCDNTDKIGGNIENVVISGVNLDRALKGIRLLSISDSVKNVTINNITGLTVGNLFEIGSYSVQDSGHFENISISNVHITVDQTKFIDQERNIIGLSGNISDLYFNNISIKANIFNNDFLAFHKRTQVTWGVHAKKIILNNINVENFGNGQNSAVYMPNSIISEIDFNNCNFTGFDKIINIQDSSEIGKLSLINNSGFANVGVGVTDSSIIDSVFQIGTYFKDTLGTFIRFDSSIFDILKVGSLIKTDTNNIPQYSDITYLYDDTLYNISALSAVQTPTTNPFNSVYEVQASGATDLHDIKTTGIVGGGYNAPNSPDIGTSHIISGFFDSEQSGFHIIFPNNNKENGDNVWFSKMVGGQWFPNYRFASRKYVSDNYVSNSSLVIGVGAFSGDGSTTEFTVSISAGFTPSNVLITPTSADAAAAQLWVDPTTITATEFTVKSAGVTPPSGTDNVKFNYQLIK